jgi:hypothetical protein
MTTTPSSSIDIRYSPFLPEGFEVQGSGFKIWSWFGIPDFGFGIPDFGFGIPDFGLRVDRHQVQPVPAAAPFCQGL